VRRLPAAGPAADSDRWPDVATVPATTVRAVAARLAFRRAARKLRLQIAGPGTGPADLPGPADVAGPADVVGAAGLVLRHPADFFRRLGADGPVGFGEAYMAGDWDTADLAGLLTALGTGYDQLVPAPLRPLRPLLVRRRPAEDQSITGSRRNIERHYDLSEEMFAAFLDDTMTYSCGLFAEDPEDPEDAEDAGDAGGAKHSEGDTEPDSLARAQRRKIGAILDLAGVAAGTRLLEIGTGWGELALEAARRGASVVSITNSPEQCRAASRRVRHAGADGLVSVELLDYRQVSGQFDAVVSVEMIEAVGDAYWPAYFTAIDHALAPGGRAAIQAITLPHRRMLQVSRSYSWMDKYIFPGAVIPSRQAIEDTVAGHTTLRVASVRPMAEHYVRTLRAWRAQFSAAHDTITALGFDEVFCRMWQFYLAYCEAGFRTGLVDVGQYLLERGQ
jgi:cyclopropane-fatty-acyl-phospholipid synthase